MVELQKQEPLYGVCRYPIKSIVVLLKIVLCCCQKSRHGKVEKD